MTARRLARIHYQPWPGVAVDVGECEPVDAGEDGHARAAVAEHLPGVDVTLVERVMEGWLVPVPADVAAGLDAGRPFYADGAYSVTIECDDDGGV